MLLLSGMASHAAFGRKTAEGWRPGKNALKHFRVLDQLKEEIGEEAVICMTPMSLPLDEKNRIVPAACV